MNRLAEEKSPYLLQHRENPVEWWPWGAEAFAEARATGRPVFLSIGYSTCHWCHVMAHESFENEAIARLMNAHFVNIKVDREERPDVDRLYMAFVQATTGSGGWPMSVWLTPEGKPFFGGTYFPPEDRHGRAGFPRVLTQIAELWREDRTRVEREGARVIEALEEAGEATPAGSGLAEGALQRGFDGFARSFDAENGGFGGAPKFPRPAVMNFLLRHGDGVEMVVRTLEKMAAGGMRDHVGGGFHRYSVDAVWHVPHFEKMLYDQAQLVCAYVEAWQRTTRGDFAGIARDTVEYVLRDLRHPAGGFFSAEDADSLLREGGTEHAEGAFYVWTRDEVVSALGAGGCEDDVELYCRVFGVEVSGNVAPGSDPHGEFDGRNILIRRMDDAAAARAFGRTEADVRASLARCRAALFARRSGRPRPHLDDKILAAWNGLMISALAKAGAALGEERFLAAAREAADFLQREMVSGGRLLRTWRDGPGCIAGFAEDYAFVIQGLLDLYEADLDERWLAWAWELREHMDRDFLDGRVGNYFGSAGGDPLVVVRMKEDYDGAEPAANSVMAGNLIRMGRMTHDAALEEAGRQVIRCAETVLTRAPTAVPQMLSALDLALAAPEQAVIAGERGEAGPWLRHLHAEFRPQRAILLATEGGFLAARNAMLAGMKKVDGRVAMYACEGFSCRTPEVDP